MEFQIEILKKVAGGLPKQLQDMQSQMLSVLEGKLKTATWNIEQLMNQRKEDEKVPTDNWKHDNQDIATKLKSLAGMGRGKKARYVSNKKALYQIVEDIEKWQARYDPTWIIINLAIGNIDERIREQERKRPETGEIPIITAVKGIRDVARATQIGQFGDQSSIWLEADDISLDPVVISNSSVLVSYETEGLVLIDTMISNPAADIDDTTKEVRNLARMLVCLIFIHLRFLLRPCSL